MFYDKNTSLIRALILETRVYIKVYYSYLCFRKTEIKSKHAYRSVSVMPSNKSTSVAKENVKNTSKTPRGSKDSKTSLKSNKSASKLSSPPKSLRTFSTEPVRTFTPMTSDSEKARVIHVIKSANEELNFVIEPHKNEANAGKTFAILNLFL